MAVTHHHFFVGWRHFKQEILNLIVNPLFLILTLIGNIIILLAATIFYYVEVAYNDQILNFFDAYYWAMMSVSTIGYGDIVPVTVPGRITAMVLVVTGVAIFFNFIGLFTSMFINIEFGQLQQEVDDLRKGIKKLSTPKKPR
jgi:voltage-gated potassium channel Kch